jgi:hypothetical protein
MQSWQQLHQHYTKIKKDYDLKTCDVIRQLGGENSCVYTNYLSEDGLLRTPSTREGTVGKKIRDLLTSGLNKTDWKPSTATYIDKLQELPINNCYMHYRVLNTEACNNGATPELEIGLCMDEGYMMSKEELSRMFTIDGIVPIIVHVSKWYQAVLRNYPYTPIGDQP